VDEITLTNILGVTSIIRNAMSLLTDAPEEELESPHGRRDLHAGFVAQLEHFS
jgi:hypothetical protein